MSEYSFISLHIGVTCMSITTKNRFHFTSLYSASESNVTNNDFSLEDNLPTLVKMVTLVQTFAAIS